MKESRLGLGLPRPKIGGGCSRFGEGELGPHLTLSPKLRPTSVPSGILVHKAVWPQ